MTDDSISNAKILFNALVDVARRSSEASRWRAGNDRAGWTDWNGEDHTGQHNLLFTVNPRSMANIGRAAGKANNIACCTCLHAVVRYQSEADTAPAFYENSEQTVEAIYNELEKIDMQPSFRIDTGHSIEVLWLLETPTFEVQMVTDINHALADILHGDAAMAGPESCLHLPDTRCVMVHRDTGVKMAPADVQVLMAAPGVRYNIRSDAVVDLVDRRHAKQALNVFDDEQVLLFDRVMTGDLLTADLDAVVEWLHSLKLDHHAIRWYLRQRADYNAYQVDRAYREAAAKKDTSDAVFQILKKGDAEAAHAMTRSVQLTQTDRVDEVLKHLVKACNASDEVVVMIWKNDRKSATLKYIEALKR